MSARSPRSAAPRPKARAHPKKTRAREGWEGWDEYAAFYDWENARTLGRRDVPFWLRVASRVTGPLLELGCGTGRISLPLARAGHQVIGVDRSAPMLRRAARRPIRRSADRAKRSRGSLSLIRGDIRTLPFRDASFSMVLAPYGILQSLVRERDLARTLSAVARVLKRGGLFGIDLVPDVPQWREYRDRVRFRGTRPNGGRVTLIESVRQDRRRRLTIFDQVYVERRSGVRSELRFELAFRTLPVDQMIRRLDRAGFSVVAILGDYRGRPWDERADTWLILAEKG